MAKKIKVSNTDIEGLVTQVAKAVAREIALQLSDRIASAPAQVPGSPTQSIQLDESIIPIKLEIEVVDSNISVEEETTEDDLSKSKAKLAALKGK